MRRTSGTSPAAGPTWRTRPSGQAQGQAWPTCWRHGLIRASFVPEPATQELRALPRTRKQPVREQASHIQRIQKTLEDTNLRLSSVLTNIMGLSGRVVLRR